MAPREQETRGRSAELRLPGADDLFDLSEQGMVVLEPCHRGGEGRGILGASAPPAIAARNSWLRPTSTSSRTSG